MTTVKESLDALGPPKAESGYRTAQVCLSGHVITGAVEDEWEATANFCPQCGAETICACPKCNVPLRGDHVIEGMISHIAESPPNHCHNCGATFPWKTAKLEAAKEHAAEIEELDESEKAQLQGAIDDLAAGGARTDLAASRLKRLMKKVGPKVGSGLYKIVLDVATEATKKAIIGS
jgi:hypothetical protein